MPIELSNEQSFDARDVNAILHTANGEPSLVGRMVEEFLSEVDWNEVLDDSDVEKLIQIGDGTYRIDEATGELVEDRDGELLITETLRGDVASLIVDMDDLSDMFLNVMESHPYDTLEEKMSLKALLSAFDLSDAIKEEEDGTISEASRKGMFRRIRATPGGKAVVNAMLGAMMNKGVIKRAKKAGKGYKSGDYERNPGGYPRGIKGQVAKYNRYKKSRASAVKRTSAMRKIKGKAAFSKLKAITKGKDKGKNEAIETALTLLPTAEAPKPRTQDSRKPVSESYVPGTGGPRLARVVVEGLNPTPKA